MDTDDDSSSDAKDSKRSSSSSSASSSSSQQSRAVLLSPLQASQQSPQLSRPPLTISLRVMTPYGVGVLRPPQSPPLPHAVADPSPFLHKPAVIKAHPEILPVRLHTRFTRD